MGVLEPGQAGPSKACLRRLALSIVSMSGMANRNLLSTGILAIVVSVSSTLSKDGFKPAPCERAFFTLFRRYKEKTRHRCRRGLRCLLASRLMGLDFVSES